MDTTIYYIAFIQAVFTTVLLFSLKSKSSSTLLLTLMFLVICVDLGLNLAKTIFHDVFMSFFPLNAWIFAYGPIILLYLRSALLKAPTNSTLYLIHFLPFFFFFSLSLVLKDQMFSFRIQGFKTSDTSNALLIVYCALSYVSVFVYSILCWTSISKAMKNIEDYYSFDKARKMVNWFKFLTIIFFIVYTIPTLIGIMSVVSKSDSFDTNIIYIYGNAVISYCTVYFLINSPEVFSGDNTESPLEISTLSKKVTYNKSQLPKETLDKCADRLVQLMEEKKVYLQTDLSLDDVANMLGYPRHYITQSLNIVLNKNFYLFVNEYRTKSFKEKVADKRYDKNTILSLAYDSGFNSKSTFNSIFKKFTGQTPTEYAEAVRKKRNNEF